LLLLNAVPRIWQLEEQRIAAQHQLLRFRVLAEVVEECCHVFCWATWV
jgi:hypothetical protein